MPQVGDIERITQNRIIELFSDKLKYRNLGNLIDRNNVNVDEALLASHLKKIGYSDILISKSIDQLLLVSRSANKDLYKANEEVYFMLRYGVKVKEKQCEKEKTVFFINWKDFDKNDFAIAEEVTIIKDLNKRPDIVVYINGIAIAVIELKRSTISVGNGIRQNLDNQRYITDFFTTIQLCVAGNDTEGMRYGVIKTPEKYYVEWKNFDKSTGAFSKGIYATSLLYENKLDQSIVSVFNKERLIEILHDFIIYDRGIKKTCRHNQYFGIKEAQEFIARDEGGIIWHTQGSGKSLSMVWLSKWILENNSEARVLVITDREELDEQIEKIFYGVKEKIYRATSGRDLIDKINSNNDRLICSLIHKFGKHGGEASDKDYESYIEQIKQSLPKDYSPKGKIFVFVDECHRTQSGKLHTAMQTILPSSIFIGFTGTPLLKSDKATSALVFGSYIHKYLFNEAVNDGVVLDLRYEARDIPQNVMAQDKIDIWFEQKTKGLNDTAKAKLKNEWATTQKIFSSKGRIERIAQDIKFDMETKPRLLNGRGNAMLVVEDIYTACRYYESFLQIGFNKCAIITSFAPNKNDISCESVDDFSMTEKQEKYEIYIKMLDGKKTDEFETESKNKFIDHPAEMRLLIVVDKLLTGFDAPPATYLYIDKSMKDHGLFQAICRVNRLDGEDKEFGFIVDYKQLFGKLGDAIADYTKGAFENFDKDDITGILKNNKDEAKNYFEENLRELDSLCEGVQSPKSSLEYQRYFCGENSYDAFSNELLARSREKLYLFTSKMFRAYTDFKSFMSEYYDFKTEQFYDEKVKFYINLKAEIGRASADFLDLKMFEPDMRYLIDTFISADAAKKISELDNLSVLSFIDQFMEKAEQSSTKDNEGVAEIIENNIRKKIIEKNTRNPKYYESMSAILDKLILDRKKGVIAFKELLKTYKELDDKLEKPENNERYPLSIKNNGALRALYDNTGENEELANRLNDAILIKKQDSFRGNLVKERRIKRVIARVIGTDNDVEIEKIFKLVCEQEEY